MQSRRVGVQSWRVSVQMRQCKELLCWRSNRVWEKGV